MHWIAYLLVSLPIAVLGLLGGGFIGNACVRWYRVSSFEGGSGYFVIGLALLGAVVGLITGLVTAGVLAPQNGAGYVKMFGAAVGVLGGLAAVITGLCWSLADIPPEIDEQSPDTRGGASPADRCDRPARTRDRRVVHGALLVGEPHGRKHESGTLPPQRRAAGDELDCARRGPAVHDAREASLDLVNGEEVMGFMVPLPARAGERVSGMERLGPTATRTESSLAGRQAILPLPRARITEPPPGPAAEEIQAEHTAEEKAKV